MQRNRKVWVERLRGTMPVPRLAALLGLDPAVVAELVNAPPPAKQSKPAKPRPTSAEKSRARRARRRREHRRAIAADKARWGSRAARLDELEAPAAIPSPAPPPADQVELELVKVAPSLEPPAANPWKGSSRFQEGMAARKLSPADRQRIHELRAEGLSTGELAKQFGVTRAAICYQLARPPSPSPTIERPDCPESGHSPEPGGNPL